MTYHHSGSFEILRWIISIAVPAISGLVGVLIGAWLTNRQQRERRKLEFVENQLKYFYSPLLGIRDEIRFLSELRMKTTKEANKVWSQLCEKWQKAEHDVYKEMTEERGKAFERIINYDNQKFMEDMLPAYHRMIDIFKEKYYLADEKTRVNFQALIEFVDIWDRFLDKSLPAEVSKKLDYKEEKLYPLYEDLQNKHDELRKRLAAGKI